MLHFTTILSEPLECNSRSKKEASLAPSFIKSGLRKNTELRRTKEKIGTLKEEEMGRKP